MFARVAVLALALPLLAAAQNCNTGAVQCCNSLEKSDSAAGLAILSTLGLGLGDVTGQIGLQCSPLSAVGVGASSCKSSPVCCQNNNVVRAFATFGGLATVTDTSRTGRRGLGWLCAHHPLRDVVVDGGSCGGGE
ncbi:Fruiting body protein SC1 [Trametes pubescens]|uniref:Hydrophobin n=1 Tax=Trametes pubescens TaxID=154538 RepID=A0A1M2V347_TRAPU|nr:Fruiting body protein SC1 [Trametes pubescens]